MAFGGAKEIKGVLGSKADGGRAGFRETDVFAGHADNATREIQRIIAGLEHTREPVESGVGIGIANGFVQCGNEVEVLLAGFVIAKEFPLQHVFEKFRGDEARTFFTALRAADGKLERVVSGPGVAIREGGDAEENVVESFDGCASEAALLVIEGAAEKLDDLWSCERFEDIDLGAREKRGNHFE